tara:strand:- start:111 stop:614 length:504 start_codon:yes stop_codon:yes gene_type:complete
MIIDATFWVSVSFVIFISGLIYLKLPQKINKSLNEQINSIKNEIINAEKLKDEAKSLLNENEDKLNASTKEVKDIIEKAKKDSEKNVIESTEKFYAMIEAKKKLMNQKITQIKENSIKEIKNKAIIVAVKSIEHLISTSIDKSKLDNIYSKNLGEVRNLLKNKSYLE